MKYKLQKSIITLLAVFVCGWATAQEEQVVTVHLCDETDPFLFGCQTFDHSGTFTRVDVGGTPMTLQLTFGNTVRVSYNDTITLGETYLFGCEAITPTAVGDSTLVDSLFTSTGCDSIVTLKLHTKDSCHTMAMSYNDTIALGETYLFGCEAIIPTVIGDSMLVDSLTSLAGCDSVVTLKLHVLPVAPLDTTIYDTVCYATDFAHRLGTVNLTKDTTFRDTVLNAVQLSARYYLDSVYTYVIKVNPTYTDVTDGDTICASGLATYTWEGESFTMDELTKTKTLQTKAGCDSVVTFTLVVHALARTQTEDIVLCAGDAIEWHGQMVDGSQKQYTAVTSTKDGLCDSILHVLNVDVHSLYMDSLPAYAKDENWLLMIDRRAIREQYGLTPTEEQVTWYRVRGKQDQLPDGESDDEKLANSGYYYTAAKALEGDYYAVINVDLSHFDKCLQVARTIVLHCSADALTPQLTPTRVVTNQPMTLSNLDANSASEITIYDATGHIMRKLHTQGVATFTVPAESVSGIYLMYVENETQKRTIKYMVINQ